MLRDPQQDFADAELERQLRGESDEARLSEAARNRARGDVAGWAAALLTGLTFNIVTPEAAFRGGALGRFLGISGFTLAKKLNDDDDDDDDDGRAR